MADNSLKQKRLQKEEEVSKVYRKEQELIEREYDLLSAERKLEDEEGIAEDAFNQLNLSIEELWYAYQFDGRPAWRYQDYQQERNHMRYLFEESRQDFEQLKRQNRDEQDEVYEKRLRLQRELEEME